MNTNLPVNFQDIDNIPDYDWKPSSERCNCGGKCVEEAIINNEETIYYCNDCRNNW
jgi:hypothetical protein